MDKLFAFLERNISAIFKLTVFVLFVGAFFLFFRIQMASDDEASPCSPAGYPGRCYFVQEKICDITLNKAEESCKSFIHSLNLPPGRLTGPTMTTCKMASYDAQFDLSRKPEQECEDKHKELQSWRRSNMGP